MDVELTLNGAPRRIECEPGETLLVVLRRAGFYSVRYGSDTGETGAAAVLVDGRLVSADVMLAAQADGHEIETVEGLDVPGEMHPIQQAFIDTGAIQSGYSTPAMVLAAKALLEKTANPTEAEIRDALSGILDRETGYLRPVHAVLRAAATMRGEAPDSVEVAHLDPLVGIGCAASRPRRPLADRAAGGAQRGRAGLARRGPRRDEDRRRQAGEGEPRVHG